MAGWRRRWRRIAVYLIAGCALSIAVAWIVAFATWRSPRSGPLSFKIFGEPWPAPVPAYWPAPTSCSWSENLGNSIDCLSAGRVTPGSTPSEQPLGFFYHGLIRAGVPFRSLERQDWSDLIMSPTNGQPGQGAHQFGGGLWRNGIPLPVGDSSAWRYFRLPIRPRPLQFVTNSLVFALALACIVEGLRGWRRYLRMRRGQCLICGYSILATPSGMCPECGTPIERSVHSTVSASE